MDNESMLVDLAKKANATDADVAAKLSGLTPEQFNWRPDKDTWSIGQQFEHLLLTNRKYVPLVEDLVKRAGPRQKEYVPKFWGKMIIKVSSPGDESNIPVPKGLVPGQEPLDPSLVQEYIALQSRFDQALEQAKGKDLTLKFTSPFAWFIRMQFGDALTATTVHNQRHIGKALLLLENPAFPKSS